MNEQQDLLTDSDLGTEVLIRRRSLLPWWIKVFTWIFLVFGGLLPLGFIAGIAGINYEIALYGLESNHPLSLTGLSLFALFALKALVAYGLWMEKEWAVQAGIIDALIGIGICVYQMFISPFLGPGFVISMRLELIALIPYLLKLRRLYDDWKTAIEKTKHID
ncbi:hypothetical protein [Chitinophaga barathri]|uniref:Uncharacterized protein n=1 Tax=Chitinophaga barathri TaxID=1647451 RepID=A0A3N4N212_9BACT|nr:hypothetical protein [Chitinophaga barathri]RPD41663.1 hypothetical protein EG028_10185 [Chitinophaga barathri]